MHVCQEGVWNLNPYLLCHILVNQVRVHDPCRFDSFHQPKPMKAMCDEPRDCCSCCMHSGYIQTCLPLW